jgi:inhibitor of cysteine peptidase
MELTVADNGRRIGVDVADTVVVRLPENATTGYVWQVADLSGPARLVDDRAEPGAAVPGAAVPGAAVPGAAGLRRLELAFTDSGAVTLRAVQRRPWEPATSLLAEYRVELRVEARH